MQLKHRINNPFNSDGRGKKTLARLNLVLGQPLAGYGLAFIGLIGLLIYRLGSLVPAFSANEQARFFAAKSLKDIFTNPVYAPHEILQYVAIKFGQNGYIAQRLVSVLFGIVAAVLFFYVVTRWFNFKVAVISTILFVTSSWYLSVARVATPEVLMLGLLAPLAFAVWLPKTNKTVWAMVVGAFIVTAMLHIPGLVWFVVLGIYWQRKSLLNTYKNSKIPSLFIISACLISSTPLLIAAASNRDVLFAYLGLPSNLGSALTSFPKEILTVPYRLILSGPDNPELNLARLPLLDFFTAIMALIGAYSYLTHVKLRRTSLLIACFAIGSILVALRGSVTITILLPFAYLLVAGGVNFMQEQWFIVFPYNPIARRLATILIVVAVGATSFYHLNRYFVAWPQAPATRQAFSHQPIKLK